MLRGKDRPSVGWRQPILNITVGDRLQLNSAVGFPFALLDNREMPTGVLAPRSIGVNKSWFTLGANFSPPGGSERCQVVCSIAEDLFLVLCQLGGGAEPGLHSIV